MQSVERERLNCLPIKFVLRIECLRFVDVKIRAPSYHGEFDCQANYFVFPNNLDLQYHSVWIAASNESNPPNDQSANAASPSGQHHRLYRERQVYTLGDKAELDQAWLSSTAEMPEWLEQKPVGLSRTGACVDLYSAMKKETLMSIRPVKQLVKSKPTLEGAGVHLRRAFGFGKTAEYDPFLLLDDFRNDIPEDYLAGFPWHPHRGIETITYVLAGTVEHGDSMGNHGSIAAGDVQWMTAGSGIIHQEMPKGDSAGRMHGFQLWANLPAALKMTAPRYQEVKAADIPVVNDDDGTHVRIICGSFWGTKGPVDGIAADPIYLDVSVPPGKKKTLPVEATRHAFAYVFAGAGKFCNASGPLSVPTESVKWLDTTPPSEADNRSLVLFERGDEVVVQAGDDGIRFLLVSGKPLEEPVAWYGPIVMNTQEQLQQAFKELSEGTFLKPRS